MIKKAIRWYCKQSRTNLFWLPSGMFPVNAKH